MTFEFLDEIKINKKFVKQNRVKLEVKMFAKLKCVLFVVVVETQKYLVK